jgi:coenzyme F420-reducing hydrogenase gamma subunit
MERLKLATVWLGGCSGCHMSFLDLDEYDRIQTVCVLGGEISNPS